ncbi:MAG TPA: short-chain dehydrogenase/reductase [Sphingobium sp.]|nr:short-chain dehydrogenase/reductase [Sphingobium sp.]
MDMGLAGQLALVTGASQGIGAATAWALAREGCDVILVSRTAEKLDRLACEIHAETGRNAKAFVADLARSEEIERLAQSCGNVDILVNNAGAIPAGRLEEIGEASWRAAWDLKIFGYINLTRPIFASMKARGAGVIVNMLGAASQIRDPSYICGVTGNAALTAFTMSLGSDSHKHGVRVLGVSPGPVATERLVALQRTLNKSSAELPFERAATVDEIAAAVVFLASPKSAYTSGTTLMIDGGLSARAAT